MSQTRHISISTPLGKENDDNELILIRMTGSEQLGGMFAFELDLRSTNKNINIDDILGQKVTVSLTRPDDETRYFNGIISRFSRLGVTGDGDHGIYAATLHPWLWLLTRSASCRIFHNMKVPDIVKQVFGDRGFSADVDDQLNSESYRIWEYCVQYRETDFNFCCRLMEQEGIYFYFRHEDTTHKIVLCDPDSADDVVSGYEQLPFNTSSGANVSERVSSIVVTREVRPEAVVLNDYDYKKPGNPLEEERRISHDHEHSTYEVYDYPGEYGHPEAGDDTNYGEEYARKRVEELHTDYEQIVGVSDAYGLMCGATFELVDFPEMDNKTSILITGASYEMDAGELSSGGDGGETAFRCDFTAVESQVPFRTARRTPKPVVQGMQTAVVTDIADPENMSRIKVKFHWAHDDSQDTNSCWVRVAQNSAGNGWGSLFPPHIGHEVIVSFLEGDPDRPIITGRVYNADNMPPDLWSGTEDNCVITDHVENKINLDGAGVPIIHITQPSGNEILMNNEEGIQIRDHFGNEIVTDAQEGTLKIRSPNHESVITLGKSVVIESTSNFLRNITGDEWVHTKGNVRKTHVGNTRSIYVGTTTSHHGGHKFTTHAGLAYSAFVGHNHESSFALKTFFGYAKEMKKNYADKEVKSKKQIKYDSEKKIWLVGGKGDEAQLILDDKGVKLFSKSGKLIMRDKTILDGIKGVRINSGKDVVIAMKSIFKGDGSSVEIKGDFTTPNLEALK